MGTETGIAYADHTFSPWEGCFERHLGCRNCYARANDGRWRQGRHWGPNGVRRVMSEAAWKRVLSWNRAALKDGVLRRVLPSICDPFEAYDGDLVNAKGEVQDKTLHEDLRPRFFQLVEDTPGLFWMLLTKRPENVRGMVPTHWLASPPANVIVCASASDQKTACDMASALVEWPGYKGLSLAPLVGFVHFIEMEWRDFGLDWVVIEGETGREARPCDVVSVQLLTDECRRAGVPCYVKQLGARPYTDAKECRFVWPAGTSSRVVREDGADIKYLGLKHPKGGDPAEWPPLLRVREYPAFMQAVPSAASI